jgi:hypothetical protein
MPERDIPSTDPVSERESLETWLEFHRATLLMKCEGLSPRAYHRALEARGLPVGFAPAQTDHELSDLRRSAMILSVGTRAAASG